jgi:hypothetical protein
LFQAATVFYPITLEGDEDFAEFAFFGKKKGDGIPRSPVERLRQVRDEHYRMAKAMDPGAALDALFGDEQRRLIAEAVEVFGQTPESLLQSLATEVKNAAGFATANLDRRLAIVASRLMQLEEEVR